MRSIALLAVLLFPLIALGNDPKELVFIFQKQKDPEQIRGHADKLADVLGKEIGLPVRAVVPGDYSASVQALVSKKADVAYVSALPFLLARRDGNARLILAEQRPDAKGEARTEYDSVFVARADSDLKSVKDIVARAKDLRMCFTSRTSTSGYVFAYARLISEGLLQPKADPAKAFREVSFGGSYTQALEQVLNGRADVAAVSYYTVEGDTATKYLKPEQLKQLKVVDRTPGVPTHLVCVRQGLSDELTAKIKAALLKASKDHPELLADVYGAKALVEVEEKQHVQKAVDAIEATGLPIEGLAR